ncbi:MAG: PPK2 family polyphosphate kinase [Bacteroidia bacterium]
MSEIVLKNIRPKAPEHLDKETYKAELELLLEELFKLQHLFYAAHSHSLLIIFQGMDTSGKDSTIRHVFSHVNPLGVQATSFKAPSDRERDHDYMWRIFQKLPEKGMIQIFNRSHYEDILVPSIQKTVPEALIEKRYAFINAFEQHLLDNKTLVLKFFLHISRDEQKKRLQDRIDDPVKRWKYSADDHRSSKEWEAYANVYERILNQCGAEIPWTIVPADDKWYRNHVVATTLVNQLRSLNLKYPDKYTKT